MFILVRSGALSSMSDCFALPRQWGSVWSSNPSVSICNFFCTYLFLRWHSRAVMEQRTKKAMVEETIIIVLVSVLELD